MNLKRNTAQLMRVTHAKKRGQAVPPVWAEGWPHPCPTDEGARGGASEMK